MNKLPRFLALSAFLGLAAALTAQPGPRGRGGRGPGGPGPGGHGLHGMPILKVLDNDQDGEISATELANAPSNLLALDVNSDGTVSADELHPRPAAAPTLRADRPERPADADHPHPVSPLLLALDADSDGALSASEIANATASLTALDANGDGKLTRDEFHPLPPEGAPDKGGRGHRGPPPAASGSTNPGV